MQLIAVPVCVHCW